MITAVNYVGKKSNCLFCPPPPLDLPLDDAQFWSEGILQYQRSGPKVSITEIEMSFDYNNYYTYVKNEYRTRGKLLELLS